MSGYPRAYTARSNAKQRSALGRVKYTPAVPFELVVRLAAIALIAWAHFRVERKGRLRDALWMALRRDKGRWTKGPAALEVRVISDSNKPVTIGTSFETPDTLGPHASLECAGVAVQVVDGPKLFLRKGAKLVVSGVQGAERRFVRAETTRVGAEQEYTFDVAPDRSLWIVGELPRDVQRSDDGPFRGESMGELEPLGDAYQLSETAPGRWIPGCGGPIAVLVAVIALPFALSGHNVAFLITVACGLIALAGQLITMPELPPTALAQNTGARAHGEERLRADTTDEERSDEVSDQGDEQRAARTRQ